MPKSVIKDNGKTHASAAEYTPSPSLPRTRPMDTDSRKDNRALPALLRSSVLVLRDRFLTVADAGLPDSFGLARRNAVMKIRLKRLQSPLK